MSERKSIATKTLVDNANNDVKRATDAAGVRITFDGYTEGTVAVMLSDLPQEIVTALAVHGLSQKLGDSYAGAKKAAENGSDPAVWAAEQAATVAENLAAGIFVAVREGDGEGRVSLLIQALEAVANANGQTLDIAATKAVLRDDANRKAVRAIPAVAAELRRLEAERAQERAAAAATRAASAPSVVDELTALFGAAS